MAVAALTLGKPRRLDPVLALRVGALLLLWAVWEAVAASGLIYRGVIPSSLAILGAAAGMIRTPQFWTDCAVTVGEVVAATVLGGVLGTVAGIAVGSSRLLAEAVEQYLHYLAATPKVVFLPVIMVLAGVGPESKMVLGALSCFFPMAISIAVAVRRIDPVLLRLGRSLRLSPSQRLRAIVLPSLLGPALTGLRLALGVATVGCLVSELKLANSGLGFEAIQAYDHFDVPAMYAVILVIFALVASGNAALAALARLAGPRRLPA
ncbi:MAG: ABC transporter permease subunit [Acetobacteraceae bacterium]|nr:ABC transporter permease subunit [Acetobacteraceae bacterium]